MKKLRVIILILLFVIQNSIAGGLYSRSNHHYVALWGNVGYAGLLSDASSITPGFGVTPAIGIGYQFQHSHFLLHVGIEGQYAYYNNKLHTEPLEVSMIDTQGKPFMMRASVLKEHDVCNSFQLQLPLLFGYEQNRFYFLAGAKVGYSLFGKTSSYSELETSGDYQQYIGVFENMPNHQFTSFSVESDPYNVTLLLNVMAHAEFGFRVDNPNAYRSSIKNKKSHPQCYLSLYADYGILNVHNDVSEGSVINYRETASDGLQFYVTPALVSEQMKGCNVHPLSVGVKFTMLMELHGKPACVICKDDVKKR